MHLQDSFFFFFQFFHELYQTVKLTEGIYKDEKVLNLIIVVTVGS